MKFTLKEARARKNMTQGDIAKLLDVYQETYSKWETGKKPLKLVTKLAIASVLSLSIDEIVWPVVSKEGNE